MTRQDINDKIKSNLQVIDTLQKENIELRHQSLLTSDDKQWYTEEKEVFETREGRKTKTEVYLIGRINWTENFKDEDTGEMIPIKRSRHVRTDGQWLPLSSIGLPHNL